MNIGDIYGYIADTRKNIFISIIHIKTSKHRDYRGKIPRGQYCEHIHPCLELYYEKPITNSVSLI